MNDILTYIKNNNADFNEAPFNRVDALILSWLSYFTYPDYLKSGEAVALKDLKARGLLSDAEMYLEAFRPKTSKKFFELLTISGRFRNLELSDYRAEKDETEEKQFAAVCMKLQNDVYYLSFRGTDPSFIGWKEDFNLVCFSPLPSQREAAAFAEAELLKHPEGKFYLGGHSKGGTAAIYAAMQFSRSMQDRILTIFNFDGPGFLQNIYAEERYCAIAAKVVKLVPNASFVGMILETGNSYSVVKSGNVSFLQHDLFSWRIKGSDFYYQKDRTKRSVRLARALNDWIAELSLAERERFIALVYAALNTLDTRDFMVFFKTFYRQIPALYREYKKLSEEDKAFFDATMKKFKRHLKRKG